MRVGTNPVKNSLTKLIHKPHRIIIPIYVPNVEEEYYKNSIVVLKKCLDSLIATSSQECTNITLINNGSCGEVDIILLDYLKKEKIDRYIKQENRGKVEAVLKEAKSSYEEYITISDADVLFRSGWLEETLKIFNEFKKAGVVSPLPVPNIYGYCNNIALIENFLSNQIRYGYIAGENDLREFENSIGTKGLYQNFYNKQFYIKKNSEALLGAAHFVATYKKSLFEKEFKKVSYVFENGLERDYLDVLAQKSGLWRLSTVKSYVYHMGDSLCNEKLTNQECKVQLKDYPVYNNKRYVELWNLKFVNMMARMIIIILKKKIHNNA